MADEDPDPPRRRPGRPRNAEPGFVTSTWLPASLHDRLVRVALKTDTSISQLIRHVLERRVPPGDEPK
jgi:hypothetical protein